MRKELRWILVQAAHAGRRSHPQWKAEFARMEKRIGSQKTVVALARKVLVIVWRVLSREVADRHADPAHAAHSFFRFAYRGIGQGLTKLRWV